MTSAPISRLSDVNENMPKRDTVTPLKLSFQNTMVIIGGDNVHGDEIEVLAWSPSALSLEHKPLPTTKTLDHCVSIRPA